MSDNHHISQLPQPKSYSTASPSKALSEISSSTNNARNNMMPPPQMSGHKRQASNLAEPPSKRKTLIERAGEPYRNNTAAPRSNTPVGVAVYSAASSRVPSSFSQSTYRSNSNTSRTTSNSSFSASVGSGLRPPSAQSISSLARPKTSLAKARNGRTAAPRPATAHGNHVEPQDDPRTKRKPSPFANTMMKRIGSGVSSRLNVTKRDTRISSPTKKQSNNPVGTRDRDISLSTAMQSLKVDDSGLTLDFAFSESPSRIPKLLPSRAPLLQPRLTTPRVPEQKMLFTPAPFPKSPAKTPRSHKYLTRFANTEAWDPEEQYSNMERMYEDVCSHYKEAIQDNTQFREVNGHYKGSISKLEEDRNTLTETIINLRSEVETTKHRLNDAERATQDARRDAEEEIENVRRDFRIEMERVKQAHREEIERLKADHREELRDVRRRCDEDLEVERSQRIQALSQVSTQGAVEKQRQQMELDVKDREIIGVKAEAERINAGLERERMLNDDLRQTLANAGSTASNMESARQALQAKVDYLESDSKSQSEAYAEMERRMTAAIDTAIECEEKLHKEETLRRKLHNQVQELKGNIRVFCRVRPQSQTEEEETAKIAFPDAEDNKEIEVKGPEETSALGKITTKSHPFNFDRVFDPSSANGEIFEEISQLIQSALDGYNVCIFAYGQTGSGKTFTMSSEDGMIPRALRQIYSTSKDLEARGWRYSMEGSFVEVYNEDIRDLLGNSKDDNNKHEIRHDTLKCETTITDVTTITLDSQDQVEGILSQAMARRSVAATKSNEHSSRSHSVFILKLQGINTITGEKSKGTLNLVDLAGSERLKESKVEGARLKETQNINKSLSCLGDVIGALGQSSTPSFNLRASTTTAATTDVGGSNGHIPYRNSKLTYLLQYSLGGNSKTLMFVMVAPEKKHLQETITSLKFAEKVGRTKVGVARKAR